MDLAYNNRKLWSITDIIFFDFSKAFDSVTPSKLLANLCSFGIGVQLVSSSMKIFLMGRVQVVVKMGDTILSERCVVSPGVPQGSVLGPLLFLIFVNNLTEKISSECRLFVDDALLHDTRDQYYVLQEDIYKLNNWSKVVQQLEFNIDTCAVLSVENLKHHQAYYLCDQRLKNVNIHPYLGVEFSHDLKWKAHIESVAAKAARVLGMLHWVLGGTDTKTKKMAYFTLV